MTRRPAWIVLDLVAVVALVGLAVVGLTTSFGGWGFLVLAEVAAAIGIAVVLVTARLPIVVLVAVAPLVGVLLGGPVALRAGDPGALIPDAEMLADVMQGAWTGWGELLATLTYVDLEGPPAMVPYVLGYAGAVLAMALAVRSRSAAGPVLPLLGVLVVVLLLRKPGDGLLAWHPLAFAGVGMVWAAFRGLAFTPERSNEIRGAAQGRAVRGVTAVLVLASALVVAVPLTVGTAESRGQSLRGKIGELPDVTALDSPLRSFREFTRPRLGGENLFDKTLFRVSGAPRGSRVRLLSLDRYDGQEWLPDNHTMSGTSEDRFMRMDSRVQNPTRGQRFRATITVRKPYRSAWVPTVGSLTSFDFVHADRAARRQDLRYNLATSTAVIALGVKPGTDYEITGIRSPKRLTPSMRPWPEQVLTVQSAPRVDRLVSTLAPGGSPMKKVFMLADHLRDRGRYSDGAAPGEEQFEAGHDRERLFRGFLLRRSPVGNDEQYAAGMAVLANRVGVPARVVVGAVLPPSGRVRGGDIEAWVEVRVADGSWRTLPTERFMSHRPVNQLLPPVVAPGTPPQPPTPPQESSARPERARDDQTRDTTRADRRSFVLRSLPWLLVLLLALVVPLVKLVRRRLRRTRGRSSDRMAGAWTELVDHARDLGIPVRPYATRPAQARVLALAGDLPQEADDGVFGVEEPDPPAVEAYWQQVMRERRVLGQGQPLRRRLWAPFNPVTLLRRPRTD